MAREARQVNSPPMSRQCVSTSSNNRDNTLPEAGAKTTLTPHSAGVLPPSDASRKNDATGTNLPRPGHCIPLTQRHAVDQTVRYLVGPYSHSDTRILPPSFNSVLTNTQPRPTQGRISTQRPANAPTHPKQGASDVH